HRQRSALARRTRGARPLQHEQLVAQREDLEVERRSGPERAAEHRQDGNQDGRHREESLSVDAGKVNLFNEYEIFTIHSHISLPRSSLAKPSRKRNGRAGMVVGRRYRRLHARTGSSECSRGAGSQQLKPECTGPATLAFLAIAVIECSFQEAQTAAD